MGRTTYESMSSNMPKNPDHPWSAILERGRKVVFSKTLAQVSHPRTRIERLVDPDEIRRLKATSAHAVVTVSPVANVAIPTTTSGIYINVVSGVFGTTQAAAPGKSSSGTAKSATPRQRAPSSRSSTSRASLRPAPQALSAASRAAQAVSRASVPCSTSKPTSPRATAAHPTQGPE